MNVISVCQPTVPVLAAISLMATDNEANMPKTMVMMGGPIDPRKSPTQVNDLATDKPFSWFENTVIYSVPPNYPGYGRSVYPGFLQHAGFVAMNPRRHAESHWEYYLHLRRGDNEDRSPGISSACRYVGSRRQTSASARYQERRPLYH
jgi:poly(3-hydroxybutyrate) depolymerase